MPWQLPRGLFSTGKMPQLLSPPLVALKTKSAGAMYLSAGVSVLRTTAVGAMYPITSASAANIAGVDVMSSAMGAGAVQTAGADAMHSTGARALDSGRGHYPSAQKRAPRGDARNLTSGCIAKDSRVRVPCRLAVEGSETRPSTGTVPRTRQPMAWHHPCLQNSLRRKTHLAAKKRDEAEDQTNSTRDTTSSSSQDQRNCPGVTETAQTSESGKVPHG